MRDRNYLEAMDALIAMMIEKDYMDVHNQGCLVQQYGKSLGALHLLLFNRFFQQLHLLVFRIFKYTQQLQS